MDIDIQTIFHYPWKSSHRTVISDNTFDLYFEMREIAEFLLKQN